MALLAGMPFASAESKTNAPTADCCAEALPPGVAISETSLYQLDSAWTTDEGKPILLRSLAGRPQVVTMFFASCQVACPILVNDMFRISADLRDKDRTNVGFVLISFDTERDTPKALAKFRRDRKIPASWTLLTAKPDDVLELAALLGVKYKKDVREQFSHSNVITLLRSNGEILVQQAGLNTDPSFAATALEKAAKERVGPPPGQ